MQKMKPLYITLLLVSFVSCRGYSQSSFNSFVDEFPLIEPPIEAIEEYQPNDTLDIVSTNKMLVTEQEPPYFIKNGKKTKVDRYYGQILRGTSNYTISGTNEVVNFETTVHPIGRINLSEDYISLIVRVVDMESIFYDAYIFTKDGELKSFVPLYIGYRDAPHKEVSYLILESEILKDGTIHWHENIDGLKTERTYVLNGDGYFEITSEEVSGKAEF